MYREQGTSGFPELGNDLKKKRKEKKKWGQLNSSLKHSQKLLDSFNFFPIPQSHGMNCRVSFLLRIKSM